MTVEIRKIEGNRFTDFVTLPVESWKLREQVEGLEAWLIEHRHELDPSFEWVADIGFQMRSDALGGGPPITRNLMQLCLESNMEIYLSEYPGFAE